MGPIKITCLLGEYVTGKGRLVRQLMEKDGTLFSEVITNLGGGNQGIRKIYSNRVIDQVFGRVEEYVPGPFGKGVTQISDGCKSYFPELNFEKFRTID